ncbi:MAG TPA: Ig-like domain-containing protein, partial [Candidatus Dormibacteraeota bacterium]|nr:Ig-like domain-containing protein [Candidatus Dormibacteraeota bacterium]
GSTESNPLALENLGGAPASGLAIADNVPGGASGAVAGTPASLAPNATAAATASYPVPVGQVEGSLTDTATVKWQDANGNPYGTLSSSFTTTVHNVLLGARLTLAPANAGPNAPGTSQTLTATLVDRNGNPLAGRTVSFTITGANPGTGTAVTDVSGIATFSYRGNNVGSDVAIANVVAPGFNIQSNTATINWLKLLQVVAPTTIQGNFFANPNNACTFDIGPGATPVFSQEFPDILFNPAPGVVPHDITQINNFTRPFFDLTTDVNGNYNGQIMAQGNGLQAGLGSLINFHAVFTGSFVIGQPGDLTFRILHDDGYIIGVGNGATRVNGDLEGSPPATTPFNGYGVVGAWDTSSTGSSSSGPVTVHFPAAGAYPFEIDYTECSGGQLFLDVLTEQFIPQTNPLAIYVGYADTLRPGGSTFPFPWQGSPNTIFLGAAQNTFDSGAIRFDNNSQSPMTFDSITVDVGTHHFDLWQRGVTLQPRQILIITQTADQNFDTSDLSPTPCFVNNNVIPQVNVTMGGVTTSYPDVNQVLNTGGFDVNCLHSETAPWRSISGTATAINTPLAPAVSLNLMPFSIPGAVQG